MKDDKTKPLSEVLDAAQRKLAARPWVVAGGGTETEFFTQSGRRLLYLFQPATRSHAFIDLDTDVFLTDEEAERELS